MLKNLCAGTYVMLTRAEDNFRTTKTEPGFRPVFHQKDNRMEGRLFISVLAYHLIAFIQKKLGAADFTPMENHPDQHGRTGTHYGFHDL